MSLENVVKEKRLVLDHGYVALVTSWGSDEDIIAAARMSTGRGFVSWDPYVRCKHCDVVWTLYPPNPYVPSLKNGFMSLLSRDGGPVTSCSKCEPAGATDKDVFEIFPKGDKALLAYLHLNRHDTPFEMAGAVIEVCAPIFVYREWHRHRTQGYNEQSARYGPLPDVNYIPTVERLMINAGGSNKQAGTVNGAAVLTEENARAFQSGLMHSYAAAEELYQGALKAGVPKELARVHLPVGRYSRMRATTNLRNWLGFLTLRSDRNPGAQWEIRQYANAVAEILTPLFPKTFELYNGSSRSA